MGNLVQSIFFITWASGVGKTTLVEWLEEKYSQSKDWEFLHFDSIGVPSNEEMVAQYGSWENWQRAMTEKWAEKVSQNHRECQKIILEGQVNLNFICSAFQERATIVLLDCSEEEISRRLKERNQLELASPEMENWRKYLRRQAEETWATILRTDGKTKEEVISEFEGILGKNLI